LRWVDPSNVAWQKNSHAFIVVAADLGSLYCVRRSPHFAQDDRLVGARLIESDQPSSDDSLQKLSLFQLFEGLAEFGLGVHDDRAVPGYGLLEWLAGD
jgi:hypothetical protein